ncbi:hypothetical protein ABVG11_14035 [Streptomyces sp. HD1123-B1]|uniref:hypothetical protein n=1 Tax=Streptomyces huangiella TaxID=3228804 RepID=UPI003D7D8143
MPTRPLRPEVAGKGPVFVDPSGRRGRLVRHAGVIAGAVCLGYSVVLAVSFAGGTAFAPEMLIPGQPISTEAFGRKPQGRVERAQPEHRPPSPPRDGTRHGPRPHGHRADGADTGGTSVRDVRPPALGKPDVPEPPAAARPRPASAEPAVRVRADAPERAGKKARGQTPSRTAATGEKRTAHREHRRTRPAARKAGHHAARPHRPEPVRRPENPRPALPQLPSWYQRPSWYPRPTGPVQPGGGAAHIPVNRPPAARPPAARPPVNRPPAARPPAARPPAAGAARPQYPGWNPVPRNPQAQRPLNPAHPAAGARPPGVRQTWNTPS